MRLPPLFVLGSLAVLLLARPAAAQDPVEFGRLSTDQKQLAEQVRRLEKILLTLEGRERAEGAESRAGLLKQAREKLIQGAQERPLALVLEEVALDLSELRAGSALERQAELILFLEELLDFLLETERREQVQDLMEAARQREAELRALADRQAELRAQTEDLQEREALAGEVDEETRQRLAEAQAELNEDIRAAAAESEGSNAGKQRTENAAEEGERAESELRSENSSEQTSSKSIDSDSETNEEYRQSEQGERNPGEQDKRQPNQPNGEQGGDQSPNEEGAQNPSEQSSQPDEEEQRSPGEQRPSQEDFSERKRGQQQQQGQSPRDPQQRQKELERAEEAQRRAEEALERATEEAAEEAKQLEGVDELETLVNVLEKCQELQARHERVMLDLGDLVASLQGASRVPRSARVRLRNWATEQRALADEANTLLFEIREAGADSFPFLMRNLVDDHGLLAKRIGPPRYRADIAAIEMGGRIQRDWQRLIDAIETEANRLRNQIEQPEQSEEDGEGSQPERENNEPSPLVSIAAEIQVLKLLQSDLLERMQSLQHRRKLLAEAGISLDEDDVAELEALVQRQKRLRTLFESILERLQEPEDSGEEI
ncbi:MAG: hypothetical protein MK209_02275 [Planctomycetes bacterium]|nr:hypothetical protein [Planctomycetota bacterium]